MIKNWHQRSISKGISEHADVSHSHKPSSDILVERWHQFHILGFLGNGSPMALKLSCRIHSPHHIGRNLSWWAWTRYRCQLLNSFQSGCFDPFLTSSWPVNPWNSSLYSVWQAPNGPWAGREDGQRMRMSSRAKRERSECSIKSPSTRSNPVSGEQMGPWLFPEKMLPAKANTICHMPQISSMELMALAHVLGSRCCLRIQDIWGRDMTKWDLTGAEDGVDNS